MQSPRSVVVASRLFLPEAGAASFRLDALVRSLEESDYDVTVLTTRPPDGTRSSGRIRRWPVLRDSTGAVRGYVQYASFDIPLFFRLLVVKRPDVVIVEPPPTTGVVARIVCGIRRIPYIYFAADVTTSAARGIGVNRAVVAMLERVERWVLRGAAAVLAVSEGVVEEVVELGAARERTHLVGIGIDTNRFSGDGPVAKPGYDYLVYAGTMSEVHGASVFVEAFARIAARHPDSRLKMFGLGVEVQALKEYAQTHLPGRVDFPGVVSADEAAEWMRGANAGLAAVRPSRGYDFAFPTKALAAISCGTRVVYAGEGPARELISGNPKLGWAVSWDVESVAAAMHEALSSRPTEADRKRMSKIADDSHSLRAVGGRARIVVDDVLNLRKVAR